MKWKEIENRHECKWERERTKNEKDTEIKQGEVTEGIEIEKRGEEIERERDYKEGKEYWERKRLIEEGEVTEGETRLKKQKRMRKWKKKERGERETGSKKKEV